MEAKPAAHAIPSMPDLSAMARSRALQYKPLRLVSWTELLSIPTPGWLVDGVLEQNSLSILYGPAGCGKSFIALDLALSVAYGRPWNGREVQAGSVLYVAAEGYQSLSRRLAAWSSYYNLEPTNNIGFAIEPIDLTGGLKTLDQFMTDCVGSMVGAEVREAEDGSEYEVETPPIKLIIFDTLARCTTGADENDARDMGRVIQWLDYLRDISVTSIAPAILVVHHSGKYGQLERGSTVMRGAADTMMHVTRDKDGPVIKCTKQKNDEPFPTLPMTIQQVADQTALVVPRTKQTKPITAPGESPLIALYREKTVLFLKALAESSNPDGLKLTEVCDLLHLPMPTAYRIRVDMTKKGFIHFAPDTRRCLITREGVKVLVKNDILPRSVLDAIPE